MNQLKGMSARERAVEAIGKDRVALLEREGIKISWKSEYDLKEFIIANEAHEELLMKMDELQNRYK
ncbi:hypothetical protein [Virgibacillus sp. CBA3643]|uniref:hypothetical protein n=1 Tax=Virgibacillus sp. CBA3643 TaxID=2942278 RepID=UPI0035A263CF